MDAELAEILSVIQKQGQDEPDRAQPSPEDLRDQAAALISAGERRQAVDTLRRAVNRGEAIGVEPTRMIPILEAMAELLWQLGDKQEARITANRALQIWFAARPSAAIEMTVDGTKSA